MPGWGAASGALTWVSHGQEVAPEALPHPGWGWCLINLPAGISLMINMGKTKEETAEEVGPLKIMRLP
jgi:hypothetical protein